MPFGATILRAGVADGAPAGVRFRLWAPAASRVDLVLEGDRPVSLPMNALAGGWFERECDTAGPGSLYRFAIDGGERIPDPASRFQPDDVHGPSAVIDPEDWSWTQAGWTGLPWEQAVIYELHVGTFSRPGSYDGVRRRLDHLADLGVTAIELMPLSDFPGRRNWGYDGVLPFAPDSAYGTPAELKRLVEAAHERGMMMFLDVVYNHFGPDGNWLSRYAPQFFTGRAATPWGAAIDFERREVRDFFIHNALYWLEEYRFDGLRLDAVHAIHDRSSPDILEEIARTVRERIGNERHVHLVLENDDNAARYLDRRDGRSHGFTAQWNDDFHHAAHVLATGERDGYYADYADRPVDQLARCLAEGFAFQGEPSGHRGGGARGEPSAHLPATAFVPFIQNHDQVGNRAFGERLARLAGDEPRKALAAILLLSPSPPLLFMGEEWQATEPFPFFCDFHDALADEVREGRRREFAHFPRFRDAAARASIPDPNAPATFDSAVLDWTRLGLAPHADWLAFYRTLLRIRREDVVPRLAGLVPGGTQRRRFPAHGLLVSWQIGGGATLTLLANPGEATCRDAPAPTGRSLFATRARRDAGLPPWFAAWFLDDRAPPP